MGCETSLSVVAGIFMACLVGVVLIGFYLLVGFLEGWSEKREAEIRAEQLKVLSKDKHTARSRKQEVLKVGIWGMLWVFVLSISLSSLFLIIV